jgi:hypothetical protein
VLALLYVFTSSPFCCDFAWGVLALLYVFTSSPFCCDFAWGVLALLYVFTSSLVYMHLLNTNSIRLLRLIRLVSHHFSKLSCKMAAAVVLAVASLAACLSASYAGPTRLTMNGVRVCLPSKTSPRHHLLQRSLIHMQMITACAWMGARACRAGHTARQGIPLPAEKEFTSLEE